MYFARPAMSFSPLQASYPYYPHARQGVRPPSTGQLTVKLNPAYLQSLGASLLGGSPAQQSAGVQLETMATLVRSGATISTQQFESTLNLVTQSGGDPSQAVEPSTGPIRLTGHPAPSPGSTTTTRNPSTTTTVTTSSNPASNSASNPGSTTAPTDSEKIGGPPAAAPKSTLQKYALPAAVGVGVLAVAAYLVTRSSSSASARSGRR